MEVRPSIAVGSWTSPLFRRPSAAITEPVDNAIEYGDLLSDAVCNLFTDTDRNAVSHTVKHPVQ